VRSGRERCRKRRIERYGNRIQGLRKAEIAERKSRETTGVRCFTS